jgi:hypothetical protein
MVEVKRHSDASRNIVEPIRRLGNIVTSIKCRDRGNVTTNASSGVAWRSECRLARPIDQIRGVQLAPKWLPVIC